MNTATQDVSTLPAGGGAVQTPMRVGAGRVNAQQAVNTQTLAYNADNPGAVSVSFGPVDATKTITLTRKVHIVNTRPTSAAPSAVSSRGLDDNPGATYKASTDGVSMPALGSVDITVSLTVDPSKLIDPQDPSRDGIDGAT